MTVQVPFDFQAGEKSLPAGEYIITRDPQMPNYLLIQCPKQKISEIVSTIPHSLPGQPTRASLTFKVYGEKYFLSEVKVSRYSLAYSVNRSKDERKLAQVAKGRTIRAIPKLDPAIAPLIPVPNFPSYPSNHSTFSAARSEILPYLFPSYADFIRALGKEAGDSRIWAGIHYEMYNLAGKELGKSVAQVFIAQAQSDGSQ